MPRRPASSNPAIAVGWRPDRHASRLAHEELWSMSIDEAAAWQRPDDHGKGAGPASEELDLQVEPIPPEPPEPPALQPPINARTRRRRRRRLVVLGVIVVVALV